MYESLVGSKIKNSVVLDNKLYHNYFDQSNKLSKDLFSTSYSNCDTGT